MTVSDQNLVSTNFGAVPKNAMRLAIIQAAVLAAMFLIAAAVSYHSGYVGGRVDGAMETEVAK